MKIGNRKLAIATHDILMVALVWLFVLTARYGFSAAEIPWNTFFSTLPLVVVVQSLMMWKFGLYKGVWRFASLPDLWNIIRASLFGVLAISLLLFLFNRLEGVPRSSLALYPIFLVMALGAPRLLFRMWKDHRLNLKVSPEASRVLVVGAGRAGEMLVRDLGRDRDYYPVGLVDDNPRLKGAKVQGLPVLGTSDDLAALIAEHEVDLVIIAMPSANTAQMRRVVERIEETGVAFRTLPRIDDMISGRSALSELREVAIDDLLGRDPVTLDWQSISEGLAGKVVLVSGGGGSIGSELCRQIARFGPAQLVILEQSEFQLYEIEMELGQSYPSLRVVPCLVDVCDAVAVDYVMQRHRPDVVFHAAAYKHVPMLEFQPREAVRNNVLGTRTLALAADRHHCSTFVMVSTDKAVNPANIMGCTKRVAEILCHTLDRRSDTNFITVRFGNVLGSAGSVVPLFQRQIEQGGPVTVTHPDIMRYFMTIPEASQLILQAGALGSGGEIFVLDMGEPIKISYLAEQMIKLSGHEPGKDIDIVYTGLRPGEKLFEELFHDQESLLATAHKKIKLAQSRAVDSDLVESVLAEMVTACDIYDNDALPLLLRKLVPEMGVCGVDDNNKIIPFERATASQ